MTDAIITYVNPTDLEWLQQWNDTVESTGATQSISGARWRDYKTLPFLLDGIQKYMPWVRTTWLVVSSMSQLKGVDIPLNGNIKVVTHDQIIPKCLLPTFNSTVIELFLYRIPGLAEQFIYFNDDMFPIAPMQESDFFVDGKPALHLKVQTKPTYNLYSFHLKNGYVVASGLTNKTLPCVMRFGHSASPMLKSSWQYLWKNAQTLLMNSCTPFRTTKNINQDVVSYYQYLSGNFVTSNRKIKYTTVHKRADVEEHLKTRDVQILCINDTGSQADESVIRDWLHDCFNGIYWGDKCANTHIEDSCSSN